MPDSENEILRLRERVHHAEATILALELLSTDVRDRLKTCEEKINAMTEEKKIASAVATELRKKHGLFLTRGQKAIGAFVGLIAIANFLLNLHGKYGWF